MTAVAGADAGRPGRLLGPDLLRAVATIAVITIHASAWGYQQAYATVALLSRFSVPVFAVLTGLLLGRRYAQRPNGGDFVRRRLSRSVLPWLVWAPLYLPFNLYIAHSADGSTAGVAQYFALGGAHLWYLLVVPQLYVAYLLWPQRRVWVAAAVALALQTALCLWRTFGPIPGDGLQTLVLTYGYMLFPFWLGYFAVGVALGRTLRPIPQRQRRLVVIAGAPVVAASGYALVAVSFAGATYATFIQGTGAFLDPLLPLLVLSLVVWLMALGPPLLERFGRLRTGVRAVSDLSLGVYIVHPMLLWYAGVMLGSGIGGPQPRSALYYAAMVVGVLLASMLATRLIAATPLAFSIGMRRAPLQGNVAVLAVRARDALRPRHAQGVDQR